MSQGQKKPLISEQLAETTQNKCILYTAAFMTALCSICMGIIFGNLNAVFTNLPANFGWPREELVHRISLASLALHLPQALTSFGLAKYFQDYSRNKIQIISNILIIIGTVFTVLENFPLFLVGYGILGLANGMMIPNSAKYIRELAPPEISGRLGSITKTGVGVGLLLTFTLSVFLPTDPEQRTSLVKIMFLLPIVLALIQLVYYIFVFKWDPPKYYFLNKDRENAEKIIQLLYKPELKDRMMQDFEADAKHEEALSFKETYQKFKRQFWVGMLVSLMFDIQGTALLNTFSTEILLGQSMASDFEPEQIRFIRYTNLGMGSIRVFFSVMATPFMDSSGRKKIYISSNALSFIGFILLGIGIQADLPFLQKGVVLLLAVSIGFGFQFINATYLAEILTYSLNCYLNVFQSVHQALVLWTGVYLDKSTLSKIIYIYIFAVLNGLGLLGVSKFVVETKGLTMNEIYLKFKNTDFSQEKGDEEEQSTFISDESSNKEQEILCDQED